MAGITNFFAGANSGAGFRSLFHEILDVEEARDFLILKGGPGVGKNTFMRAVGAAAEAAGLDVEYLWCSGDPRSLDGVVIPALRCAVADGTSPHVLEPRYPAAVDRYVDLGRFYDITAAKRDADAVKAHTRDYKAAYVRAYSALNAARQVERDAWAAASLDRERAARRLRGLLLREARRKGPESGRTTRRFLGSVTCQGYVWRFDSVDALCERVYVFEDSFGFAGEMLSRLHDAFTANGWDTVACVSPEEPERIEHLLIPGLRLAFVTSREGMEYPAPTPDAVPGTDGGSGKRPFRRIRLDALTEVRERPRWKLERRMVSLLRGAAVEALAEAHACHDRLEAVYNPYVDFDGVRELARRESERILSYRA